MRFISYSLIDLRILSGTSETTNCNCYYMNGRMLAKKIIRLGDFWLTMESDCSHFVKTCHKSQVYTNFNHLPPRELDSMTTPRPALYLLGVGGLTSLAKSTKGHELILVAIDYLTKWVEAAPFAVLKSLQLNLPTELSLSPKPKIQFHRAPGFDL